MSSTSHLVALVGYELVVLVLALIVIAGVAWQIAAAPRARAAKLQAELMTALEDNAFLRGQLELGEQALTEACAEIDGLRKGIRSLSAARAKWKARWQNLLEDDRRQLSSANTEVRRTEIDSEGAR